MGYSSELTALAGSNSTFPREAFYFVAMKSELSIEPEVVWSALLCETIQSLLVDAQKPGYLSERIEFRRFFVRLPGGGPTPFLRENETFGLSEGNCEFCRKANSSSLHSICGLSCQRKIFSVLVCPYTAYSRFRAKL